LVYSQYSQNQQGQNRYPISQFNQDPNNSSQSKGQGGNFQMNPNPQFQRGRMDNNKGVTQSNVVNEQKSQPTTPIQNQMQPMPQRIPPTNQYNQPPLQTPVDYNKSRDMQMAANVAENLTPVQKNMPPSNTIQIMQNKPIGPPMNNGPPTMQTGYQIPSQSIPPQNQTNQGMMPNQKIPGFMHNNPNYYDRPNPQNFVNPSMYPEDMNPNYIGQNMGNYMSNPNMYMRQQQQPPIQNPQNFPPMQNQNPNFYPGQVNPNTYNQMNAGGYQMASGYGGSGGVAGQTGANNKGMNVPSQQMSAMSNEERRMLLEKIKNMSWKDRPTEGGHQQQQQSQPSKFF